MHATQSAYAPARFVKTITLMVMLAIAQTSPAIADGEGTTAAPFLKIGTSARAEAMGGAFSALVNDVDSNYWNPAGLARLRRSTIGFTHLEWFEDIRYEYLSYADKFDYIGAVGVSVGYLFLGNIPKTLETPSGDFDNINSQGVFGASDLMVSGAWAGSLFGRENKFGVGVKVFQEAIDDAQAFCMGLDIGDQYLLSRTAWYRRHFRGKWLNYVIPHTLALSVRNLGMPVKYFYQNDPLPTSCQLGLGYQLLNDNLNAAVDVEYRMFENLVALRFGGEYWFHKLVTLGKGDMDVAVRAGYRTGFDATSAPGISVGAGVVYSSLGLDYVFMPYGDLGMTHRVSLKFSWGEVLKDKTLVKRKKAVHRELSPNELALQETAQEMVKSKKSMESKVMIKKAVENKRTITELEAKKPGEEAVNEEAKTLGAEIKPKAEAKSAGGPAIQAPTNRVDSTALITQITRGAAKPKAEGRTQSQYTLRTSDDAIRMAKREAEIKGQAFDEVETAAQAEARQNKPQDMVTKTTVYFAKNSDKLNDKYLTALDQIARSFDASPQRTILVHGYASADEDNATSLALNRAKAAKDYLVQIKSLPGNNISVKSFGDKDPAGDNNTDKGRALNRRVRVQIIQSGN